MQKGLETALDECLTCLAKGESLEACLLRFPRLRDELEPLLQTALIVRQAYRRPAPSQAALGRGRARFLVEGARRRAEVATKRTPWWNQALRPAWAKGLATVALTAALLVGAWGGGSAVSANSLPGDPLYGVKRASERVRYFLTLGTENRERVQRALEDLRVQEVHQVLEQRRNVEVQFAGVVDGVEGNTILVQGISVQLPQDALSGSMPTVGSQVQIDARTRKDGTIAAKAVAVRTQPLLVVTPTVAVQVVATATSPAQLRPTSTATEKPAEKPTATLEPTYTSAPSLTPTLRATATLSATETVEPTDTTVPSITPTTTQTSTPMPTPTLVPPPRDIKVRIEGRIDEIGATSWVVGSQRMAVQSSTLINQSAARAQVGGWAVVNAIKRGSDALIAQEIIVVRGAEQPPEPKEFSGAIDSFTKERWVVGGKEVFILADTVIEGTPEVGAIAHVKGEQRSDGRLVAKRITVERRAEQVVQFEGLIQALNDNRWVVAGQEVFIASDTQVEGTPVVGAIAVVEAVVRADGSKWARHIKVEGTGPGLKSTATPVPPTAVPPTSVPPTAVAVTPTAPTPSGGKVQLPRPKD
jgi:hypothetical protein